MECYAQRRPDLLSRHDAGWMKPNDLDPSLHGHLVAREEPVPLQYELPGSVAVHALQDLRADRDLVRPDLDLRHGMGPKVGEPCGVALQRSVRPDHQKRRSVTNVSNGPETPTTAPTARRGQQEHWHESLAEPIDAASAEQPIQSDMSWYQKTEKGRDRGPIGPRSIELDRH